MRNKLYREIFIEDNSDILYKIRDILGMKNPVGHACDTLGYALLARCSDRYDEESRYVWNLYKYGSKADKLSFIDSILNVLPNDFLFEF